MSTYKGQSNYSADPPPYPKWWDYLNGAVATAIILAAACAVLGGMVVATLATFW